MHIFCLIFFTLITFLVPIEIGAESGQKHLKDKMIRELDIIQNTFEVHYAPAQWKKTFADWDLNDQISQAKEKILSSNVVTIKDFQQILKKFFRSTRDYHVGVYFYSTASSFLPFRVQKANDKYFVIWVKDAKLLAKVGFPSELLVGDEILTFNSEPIDKVIAAFKDRELGNPESATDQGMAEIYLTARTGKLGHEIPQGTATITFRHPNSKKILSSTYTWSYNPEKITHGPNIAQALIYEDESKAEETHSNSLDRFMCAAFYRPFELAWKESMDNSQAMPIGYKKSLLPQLGKVIWKTSPENTFQAYVYLDKQNRPIGFVRIPSYMEGASQAREFATIIKAMEEKTKALVIDQTHNPGGGLFYMYGLASMFANKPLKLPKHRIALSQEEVFEAINFMGNENPHDIIEKEKGDSKDTFNGFFIDRNFTDDLFKYYEFVINEWNAGSTVSNPCYILGIPVLKAHPWGVYTKPVLLLVDNMDISGGDFFPAILQDNKRATVMGSRTSGAGGVILTEKHSNRFDIAEYTFTGTIAERLDLNPIENLGVIPDVPYTITEADLQSGYKDYAEAIHKEVNKLLTK